MMRCWLLTFEEGFLKDEVVDVEAAGEASVVVGEAHIAGLLQREQLFHLQSMTFFLFKFVSLLLYLKKKCWGVQCSV